MTHNVGAMITWSLFASEAMTADEFHEAYPDEREEEVPSEEFDPSEEPHETDIVTQNNKNEEEN